jgi:hypothetical protein
MPIGQALQWTGAQDSRQQFSFEMLRRASKVAAENHINFVYKLDGSVTEVDVFKLAPTLLALGELIQESNQQINTDGRQIGVNVKPFREGSFIVDLTVFPQTNLQQLLDLLGTHSIEQVKNLLEWIGLITGTGGVVGVVQLIKWLKGKPKSVDQIAPGEFRYTAHNDTSITVNAPVHQLFSNANITNHIYQVYAAPMEQQSSVDDVKTYIEGAPQTEVQVSRNEVPILKEAADTAPPPVYGNEIVKESVHKGVYLNPKRGSFENDPRDWSFYKGDEIITPTIKDKLFLKDYAEGLYRLNYTDLLTVDLLERQTVVGTIVKRAVYEVLRVTNYIKGPTQTRIPDADSKLT